MLRTGAYVARGPHCFRPFVGIGCNIDCSVTPLYVASGFNGIDVCALLLAHKADVNGSTHAACCHASCSTHTTYTVQCRTDDAA